MALAAQKTQQTADGGKMEIGGTLLTNPRFIHSLWVVESIDAYLDP